MVLFTYIFWILISVLIYTYLGYPIIIYILSKIRREKYDTGFYEPSVSILIAAYNEEKNIKSTIENKLALKYPSEKVEIIVISDGSTDRTDKIVKGYHNSNVRLIRQSPRNGKTSALNLGVLEAKGEILVFSDANSIFDENALQHIVHKFINNKVGYVTGRMVYTNPDGSLIGDGCSAYMKYEHFLREGETNIGSVVGSNGGIDAVRKSLYDPMRADQLPDFILPLKIAEKGYRVAYEPKAVLKEQSLTCESDEYRMRIRVSLRALWALYDMKHMLNPFKYKALAWQIVSHKLLRYTAFIFLILTFVTNAVLLFKGIVYIFIFFSQIGFYSLAYMGKNEKYNKKRLKITNFPYYFTLLNLASAIAFGKFVQGKKQVFWEPRVG